MRWYKDIPIWENRRRSKLLIEFKNSIVEYFNSVEYRDVFDLNVEPIENEGVQRIRSRINLVIHEIHFIVLSSGVAPTIYYSSPPAVGGIAGNIDLINNIFNLRRFEIDTRHLIDIVEGSIGLYERDRLSSFLRTINPFYWIALILNFLVSLPFQILGRVGFNQEKMENSVVGKAIKGTLYLITVFSAFLTIVEKLGYLQWVKNLFFKL